MRKFIRTSALGAIVLAFHNVTGRLRGDTAQVPAAARRWLSAGEFVLEVHPFADYKVAESSFDRSAPSWTSSDSASASVKLSR